MGLKHLGDNTSSNSNQPSVNGQIMLHKDKEALDAFFKENVVPNTMVLIQLLIKSTTSLNCYETAFLKYRQSFWKNCINLSRTQNFQFKSFMAAYKFIVCLED